MGPKDSKGGESTASKRIMSAKALGQEHIQKWSRNSKQATVTGWRKERVVEADLRGPVGLYWHPCSRCHVNFKEESDEVSLLGQTGQIR